MFRRLFGKKKPTAQEIEQKGIEYKKRIEFLRAERTADAEIRARILFEKSKDERKALRNRPADTVHEEARPTFRDR